MPRLRYSAFKVLALLLFPFSMSTRSSVMMLQCKTSSFHLFTSDAQYLTDSAAAEQGSRSFGRVTYSNNGITSLLKPPDRKVIGRRLLVEQIKMGLLLPNSRRVASINQTALMPYQYMVIFNYLTCLLSYIPRLSSVLTPASVPVWIRPAQARTYTMDQDCWHYMKVR